MKVLEIRTAVSLPDKTGEFIDIYNSKLYYTLETYTNMEIYEILDNIKPLERYDSNNEYFMIDEDDLEPKLAAKGIFPLDDIFIYHYEFNNHDD